MQHKLLMYTYDKSMAGYRGISPDNFADEKIHCIYVLYTRQNKQILLDCYLNKGATEIIYELIMSKS